MKPAFAFPKSARLLTSEGYGAVFEHAEFRVSSKRILLLARNTDQNQTRIGLIVAKKHVKLAVQRNRLKRVARESFRLHQQRLPHLDIVILFKHGSDLVDSSVLHADFVYLWRKLITKSSKPVQRKQEAVGGKNHGK